MPLTQSVRVPTMIGYVPPKGFRIVMVRKLDDGSYEVTLEPWELPRGTSGVEAVAAASIPVMIVMFICTMLSTVKNEVIQ